MIDYEVSDRVAVITIRRPEARNAINGEVASGIEGAIDRLEGDPDLWVGVLAGATGSLLVTDAWFDVILSSDTDELRTALFLAAVAELPAAAVCFWIAYRTEHFLARVVGSSHLAATQKSPPESDLVGIFKVSADGEAAREARHPDAAA